MTPLRVKTYVGLFLGLTVSIVANVMLLQPKTPRLSAAVRVTQDGAVPVVAADAARNKEFVPGKGQSQQAAVQPKAKTTSEVNSTSGSETVRAVQRELQTLGYYTGQHDGVASLMTHAAVMAFQHDHAMPISGEPSETLLKALILGASPVSARARPGPEVIKGSPAEQVMRTVQQSLASLGYGIAKVDGRVGDDTQRSIREFEMDQAMKPSGRISAPLLAKLARAASAGRMGTPK